MSELARKCTGLVMSTLEARVGAAQSLTSEAYALACEQHVGLDGVDHEVLADRLVAATLHLSSLIAAMLPEGRDDAIAIAAVASRHRPRVDPHVTDPRRYLAALTRIALRHATRARRLVERVGINSDSRVLKSVVAASSNLEIAGYLVVGGPRRNETMETVLHECREVVRRRRGYGGEVTAV